MVLFMSITFYGENVQATKGTQEEHCLCAQFAPGWMHDATPEVLREHAHPECPSCKGRGIETVPTSDEPTLNLANINAMTLLEALGIEADYCGRIDIPTARRGLMRARSISLAAFERPAIIQYGAPREVDGVVELKPLRAFQPEFTAADVAERVARFGSFLDAVVARGGTAITWG